MTLNRRTFLKAAGATGLASAAAAAPKRPNVVIFIADDLAWHDLGCYGGTNVPTPNIDREPVDRVLSSSRARLHREFPELPEPPEDHDTFEGNALQKARFVFERTGVPCIGVHAFDAKARCGCVPTPGVRAPTPRGVCSDGGSAFSAMAE